MSTLIELNPAPPVQESSRGQTAPWVIAGLAVFGLLLAAVPAPSTPTLAAVATREPVIETDSSQGWGDGVTVYRDEEGALLAVVLAVAPFASEGAWCKIAVDGRVVEVHSEGARPAVCAWVRGAV